MAVKVEAGLPLAVCLIWIFQITSANDLQAHNSIEWVCNGSTPGVNYVAGLIIPVDADHPMRVCRSCSICSEGFWESVSCGPASDTICTQRTSCSGRCEYDQGARVCKNRGEILPCEEYQIEDTCPSDRCNWSFAYGCVAAETIITSTSVPASTSSTQNPVLPAIDLLEPPLLPEECPMLSSRIQCDLMPETCLWVSNDTSGQGSCRAATCLDALDPGLCAALNPRLGCLYNSTYFYCYGPSDEVPCSRLWTDELCNIGSGGSNRCEWSNESSTCNIPTDQQTGEHCVSETDCLLDAECVIDAVTNVCHVANVSIPCYRYVNEQDCPDGTSSEFVSFMDSYADNVCSRVSEPCLPSEVETPATPTSDRICQTLSPTLSTSQPTISPTISPTNSSPSSNQTQTPSYSTTSSPVACVDDNATYCAIGTSNDPSYCEMNNRFGYNFRRVCRLSCQQCTPPYTPSATPSALPSDEPTAPPSNQPSINYTSRPTTASPSLTPTASPIIIPGSRWCYAMGTGHYRDFQGRFFDRMGSHTSVLARDCRPSCRDCNGDGIPTVGGSDSCIDSCREIDRFEVQITSANVLSMPRNSAWIVSAAVRLPGAGVVELVSHASSQGFRFRGGPIDTPYEDEQGNSIVYNNDTGLIINIPSVNISVHWTNGASVIIRTSNVADIWGGMCGICGSGGSRLEQIQHFHQWKATDGSDSTFQQLSSRYNHTLDGCDEQFIHRVQPADMYRECAGRSRLNRRQGTLDCFRGDVNASCVIFERTSCSQSFVADMCPVLCASSCAPTSLPTTMQPTESPTANPSHFPSMSFPTSAPSITPSDLPSTTIPSATPTNVPSISSPSRSPVPLRTFPPTTLIPRNCHGEEDPPWCIRFAWYECVDFNISRDCKILCGTCAPTAAPSSYPTQIPSMIPTLMPTLMFPTNAPSISPSMIPTLSFPTNAPSISPSMIPTSTPTTVPTYASPTSSPSIEPTIPPTGSPTRSPSRTPSSFPTNYPSTTPSQYPSISPSANPTNAPSRIPSYVPSKMPTSSPTRIPTNIPTQSPVPSDTPTISPSLEPTMVPSRFPTIAVPTEAPSTLAPTFVPSQTPSNAPTTLHPTHSPTQIPSSNPSTSPTVRPTTSTPSMFPTVIPTFIPTDSPSPALNECTFDDSNINLCTGDLLVAARQFCAPFQNCSGLYSPCFGVVSAVGAYRNCLADFCVLQEFACESFVIYEQECRLAGVVFDSDNNLATVLSTECRFSPVYGPCLDEPCLNGGECRVSSDGDSFDCDCPEGFEAPLCEPTTTTTSTVSTTTTTGTPSPTCRQYLSDCVGDTDCLGCIEDPTRHDSCLNDLNYSIMGATCGLLCQALVPLIRADHESTGTSCFALVSLQNLSVWDNYDAWAFQCRPMNNALVSAAIDSCSHLSTWAFPIPLPVDFGMIITQSPTSRTPSPPITLEESRSEASLFDDENILYWIAGAVTLLVLIGVIIVLTLRGRRKRKEADLDLHPRPSIITSKINEIENKQFELESHDTVDRTAVLDILPTSTIAGKPHSYPLEYLTWTGSTSVMQGNGVVANPVLNADHSSAHDHDTVQTWL